MPAREPKKYTNQEKIMRYHFASKFVKGKSVLDAGCGTGYGSSYLARKGAKLVVGIDISKDRLKSAKENYDRNNLCFMKQNVRDLPFNDNSFNVVVSFEVIEHLPEEATSEYLQEMKRVLKSNGIFICSTPNIKYSPHYREHLHEFYPKEFFQTLEEHFEEVKRYGQYIDLITFFLKIQLIFLKERIFRFIGKLLSQFKAGREVKNYLNEKLFNKKGKETLNACKIKDEWINSFSKHEIKRLDNKLNPLNFLGTMVAISRK